MKEKIEQRVVGESFSNFNFKLGPGGIHFGPPFLSIERNEDRVHVCDNNQHSMKASKQASKIQWTEKK